MDILHLGLTLLSLLFINNISAESVNSTSCKCGWVNRDPAKIIGGEYAEKNEWPMMVALMFKKEKFQFCGGTIISRHHVLTAGHCLHNNGMRFSTNMFGVAFGVTNLDEISSDDIISPEQIILHPKYRSPLKYDLAILVMKEIIFSDIIGPACLPAEKFDAVGKTLDHTGWGLISPKGKGSRLLKKTKLKGISLMRCYKSFGTMVDLASQHQSCTYQRGTSQCKGDSGGPIFWADPDTDKYTVVGVISFGWYSCDSPAVNTDISSFMPWIQSVLRTKGDEVCFAPHPDHKYDISIYDF